MAELHPLFAHFPIAMYVSAFLLELFSIFIKKIPKYISLSMVYIGAIMGIFAALSGSKAFYFADKIPLIIEPLGSHETAGNILTWSGLIGAFILLYCQLKQSSILLLKLIIIGSLAVGSVYTGLSGSKLVREFGAGTNLVGNYFVPLDR